MRNRLTLMKGVLVLLLGMCVAVLQATPNDIIIPRGTTVRCDLKADVTLDDKPGKVVAMEVANDVVVNGTVVITKGSPVYATIRINQKAKQNYYTGTEYMGELLIDIFSTKGVDGSEVKFADCYIQFFAERNGNWWDKKRKWLIGTGTTKNCETRLNYTVKVP